jgi:hypothetical protein
LAGGSGARARRLARFDNLSLGVGSIIGALDIGKYADFAFLDADLREELTGLLNGYGRSEAWGDPTHRGLCSRFGARDPGERYL